MQSPVEARFVDRFQAMMLFHLPAGFGMITGKKQSRNEGGSGNFGIIGFTMRIGFVACGFEEVVDKAVNCDGLVSHGEVV